MGRTQIKIEPNQKVKYKQEFYTVYACNPTYALLETMDGRKTIQVLIKDLLNG